MKRTKTVVARGTCLDVTVRIELKSRTGHLMRDEMDNAIKATADAAMHLVAKSVPYLNVHMSDVQVRP